MAVNHIFGESNILVIYFLWVETSSVWFVESWDFCFCCETGDAPKPELKTPQGQWFQDVSSRAGVKSPPKLYSQHMIKNNLLSKEEVGIPPPTSHQGRIGRGLAEPAHVDLEANFGAPHSGFQTAWNQLAKDSVSKIQK